MVKLYGEEAGTAIFTEHYLQNKIFTYHGLAWQLGKECLPYFCEIFLHDLLFDYSGGKVPLSKLHYEIWDELQNTLLNKSDTRHLYILPRGFGKTNTITLVAAMWSALYCVHPFTVIQSAVSDRAENFISNIKLQLEDNKMIDMCFGQVHNKNLCWNAKAIELDIKPQRTRIEAVSSTGMVRGIQFNSIRVGLLLLDDAQNIDDIKSEDACRALYDNFSSGIMQTLETARNNVIAVGTVYRVGDLYDTLYHTPTWKKIKKRCVDVDNIDLFFKTHEHWLKIRAILVDETNPNNNEDAKAYYYQHKQECDYPVIWEKYSCYELFAKWVENPVAFKREYQSDITSLGERRITSLAAIPAEEIESLEFNKTILAVDPASATSKKADYSAFCVLSDTDSRLKYVRKLHIAKLEFDDYIQTIIDLLKAYTDITTVFIEKNVYMGADAIKLRERIEADPELRGRSITLLNKATTRNKDNRIDAIIPDINNHRLIFNKDDTEAIEQVKEFAGTAFTAHDDAIDALTLAMENLPQVFSGGKCAYISYRELYR